MRTLDIEVEIKTWRKATHVLRLQGHLETQTLPKLEKVLDAEMKKPPWRWAVDLSQLEYISSAGIAIFMKVNQLAENKGGGLCFFAATESVDKVLKMLNMYDFFNIFKTEADARQDF